MGPCNGSSFPSKSPSYYGGDSMLTLKERTEKEDERERWVAEYRPYPHEREGSAGDQSSHVHHAPPPSSLHHDRGDSTHKKYGFFHSPAACGGGELGREARSRWEGEYQGGGEVQSSFHSSHQPGSAQCSGNTSLQFGSRQYGGHQQKGRVGYNVAVQRQGSRER